QLLLLGNGSVGSSSKVIDNGSFDLSATNTGASIKSLAGMNTNAGVFLGSNTLTITNANDTFAGQIHGPGTLILDGGNQTLTGANDYSGGTLVNAG
ncbi:UNVERIFIED_CONTAM: autotransporter outer membrane beta-barrel domain-containing protein, partial [Bacteroidetes bacterium 56_B9]